MNLIQAVGKKMELTRKNWIQLVAMTVVFVIAAFLVYNTTITARMVLTRVVPQIKAEKLSYYEVKSGDHLEQSFYYDTDELLAVGTSISVNDNAIQDLLANQKKWDLGIVHLDVRNEAGNSIMQTDYQVAQMEDEQNLLASFPQRQEGWKGNYFTLVIDAEDICDEVGLKIGYTDKAVENASLSVNGERWEGNINVQTSGHQFMYWRRWFYIGCILLYLLFLGTYFLLTVFRVKPEQVFLFTGTILSAVYLFLLPPLSVPDEEVHFKEAYYHLNRLQGKQQTEGKVLMDLEDYRAMQKFESKPSLSEYDVLKEAIKKRGRKEGAAEKKRFDTQAPMITYLPGMIGIFLGKALGLNGVLVICLGRVCSILFYLFIMYWFIRLMPFGKGAAFMMAILPMTIQQCCSYSYDSVVIEMAFLYVSVLLGLIYGEKPIQKWQIALYIVFMVIFAICKGGAYLPLCLLTMLIPVSRFQGKKQKWIFVGIMAAIAVTAFLSGTLSYVLYVAAPTKEQAAASYLGNDAYGAAGLLKEPVTFLLVAARSLALSGDGFLETMLGMQLGWLNIFVSRIVIYGFLLLMFLSFVQCEKQDEIVVTAGQKASYAAVAMLSVLMVLASMFMSWTPRGSIEIAGVQGRYFLPVLPAALLLFRSKNIVAKTDRSRAYMFLAVCLQLWAIYGILLSLENVA